MEVRQERSGFRDQNYSNWHRQLGWDAPTQDIDCVEHQEGVIETTWVEFDRKKVVALIELKAHFGQLNFNSCQFEVLKDLALHRPLLAVQYDSHAFQTQDDRLAYTSTFKVTFVNQPARQKLIDVKGEEWNTFTLELSERRYVAFLYWLRGRKTPAEIAKNLNDGGDLAATA